MAKYVFPAIFDKETSGAYSVSFPDVDGCLTSGESLEEAIEMAQDALCLMLYYAEEQGIPLPKASEARAVRIENEAFVSLIAVDTLEYRKLYDSKTVKKTLTVPAWLNTMAEKQSLNFSAVLQKALKNELNISEN